MERDDLVTFERVKKGNFNSHAHVERDKYACHKKLERLNFNSHAHVERDRSISFQQAFSSISTHTLTWSVTWQRQEPFPQKFHFNSHAHVERD